MLLQSVPEAFRAIGIREDYSQAYYQRGYSCSNLGQYQRAIEDLTQAIQLAPDFARAIDLRFADRIILEGAYGAGHRL